MKNGKKSFTIIELLVIISIIGLLSSVVLVYVQGQIEKARDARRISDMDQIQKSLEIYFDKKGKYPDSENEGVCEEEECPFGGWDVGNVGMPTADTFIQPLVTEGIFGKVPVETVSKMVSYSTYRYHRYVATEGICEGKAFYILAAYLNNSQLSYGSGDKVDSCYDVLNTFWRNEHWYTIMGIE
jgi:type II secretory pathway pseudopilin PulG